MMPRRDDVRAAIVRLKRCETKYDRRIALALLASLAMLVFGVLRHIF